MSIPLCKFYNKYQTCRFGEHCRYLHSSSDRPPDPSDLKEHLQIHLEEPSNSLANLDISREHHTINIDQNGQLLEESSNLPSQNLHQDITISPQRKHAEKQLDTSLNQSIKRSFCFYFGKYGSCRYGSDCKFVHNLSGKNDFQGSNKRQAKFKDIPPRFRTRWDEKITTENTRSHVDDHIKSNKVLKINEQARINEKGNDHNKRRVCPFFKSGRCNRGTFCQFVHNREDTKASSNSCVPDNKNDVQADNRGSNDVQTEQTAEPHRHDRSQLRANDRSVSQPLHMKQLVTYAELESMDAIKVRDSEVNTIKKRFPRDKITILEDTSSSFSARIVFTPTDPDWIFDVRVFELVINIPSNYPKEMMNVTLPVDQNLPETVRRYIEVSIREWLDQKVEQLATAGKVELVFRPFLLWLDRNIEDITTEALKQFKRELIASAVGMEFIPAEKLQAKFKTQGQSSESVENKVNVETDEETSSGSEDGGGDRSEDSCDEDCEDNKMPQRLNIDPEKKGTEIELRHVQLRENASAMMFERLKLVLQCGRCKNHSDLVVAPGKVMSVQCEKCNQNQFVHFRAALIHQFSSVAGYLDVDGCQAFDLIFQDSCAAVTCLSCSKQTRINGLVTGHLVDGWCQACNARFKIATEAVKFVQLQPSSINTAASKVVEVAPSKNKKPPKDPAIREGCPLPEFGTCKHYKHSYRWLRFPCCGKAYPCDLCHDRKEDHEMVYATRMICGHCCREQNYSSTRPCNACGQHLTKIRTAHWEGGSGCRDRLAMSKNDQQKYKNMNKTQSNHQKKVQTGAQKKNTKLRHT